MPQQDAKARKGREGRRQVIACTPADVSSDPIKRVKKVKRANILFIDPQMHAPRISSTASPDFCGRALPVCLQSAATRASEVRRVPRGRAGAPAMWTARAVRHLAAQPRAHAARIASDVQADAADGARPTLIAADDGLEADDAVLAAFGARLRCRRRM